MPTKRKARRSKKKPARSKPAPDAASIFAGMEMLGFALMCGCDIKKINKAANKLESDLKKCIA